MRQSSVAYICDQCLSVLDSVCSMILVRAAEQRFSVWDDAHDHHYQAFIPVQQTEMKNYLCEGTNGAVQAAFGSQVKPASCPASCTATAWPETVLMWRMRITLLFCASLVSQPMYTLHSTEADFTECVLPQVHQLAIKHAPRISLRIWCR